MSAKLPLHVEIEGFDVIDDCLAIDGRKITDIAAEIGRTPFYLYSRTLIDKRLEKLRGIIPAAVELHYAIKANPMPAVVQHIAPQVDGLDVASQREMEVALAAGMAPDNISFAGPGKTPEELEAAVAAGITLNCESPLELERLVDAGHRQGKRPQVAIRVNPDFELKASGMKMSGGPKQFGIDAEQVPGILQAMKTMDLDFQGFHIFSGSQNLSGESIADAQRKSLALALKLTEDAPCAPRIINIGGGFGIPYFPGDKPLDTAPIAACLGELAARLAQELPTARLAVELGRYIIGEAGIYVCKVIDRKVSRGQVFLVTDGGLHHHLAASGNFGQVLRKNYPALIGNHVQGTAREKASVVGPLCTPLDVLADRMEMAQAAPGDLAVVFQSGAYGLTASPIHFLSHPEPADLLI